VVTRSHLVQAARELKRRLGKDAFKTIDRVDITGVLRKVSGEDTTRMKSVIAGDLERAMLEQGVRCYPSLVNTTTGDTVRIFHAGTVLGQLVDTLAFPSTDNDSELGEIILKVKGMWKWAPAVMLPTAVVDSQEA
jgi:hypothetical protein